MTDETWQQPPLLAAPERARTEASPAKPAERIRQAGLVGIAQARAALAEAARRAERDHAAAQGTTKAA